MRVRHRFGFYFSFSHTIFSFSHTIFSFSHTIFSFSHTILGVVWFCASFTTSRSKWCGSVTPSVTLGPLAYFSIFSLFSTPSLVWFSLFFFFIFFSAPSLVCPTLFFFISHTLVCSSSFNHSSTTASSTLSTSAMKGTSLP